MEPAELAVCPQMCPGLLKALEVFPARRMRFPPLWLKASDQKWDNENVPNLVRLLYFLSTSQVIFHVWVESGNVLTLRNVFTS